ncbi:MAG TPA: hypothetical protein VE868_06490, partial [Balneolaceae bacterium]|nr:hypothetical protein [Balneolaceae bacterium]
MKKESFEIKELNIRKMPGLPEGLTPYRELSPQINIIAGPNASGKSSTARAIQQLIWGNKTSELQIEGKVDIGDEPWAVKINSNNVEVTHKGQTETFSGLPAVEAQSRYMLALHNLITADEKNLAKTILQESIGGYDIERASEELEYSPTTYNRSINEYKSYKKAEKALKKQQNEQKEVKKQQDKLSNLYREKNQAGDAQKRGDLYEQVVKYLQAKRNFEQRQEIYRAFPQILDKAHGEELKQINGLEEEIAAAERLKESALSDKKACRERLAQLDIPAKGVTDGDLYELEDQVEKLDDLEATLRETKAERKKIQQKKKKIQKDIGDDSAATDWEGIDLQDVGDLDEFFAQSQKMASQKTFLEKEIAELDEEPIAIENHENIEEGIKLLSQWLKEPENPVEFPSGLILAIAGLAALAIVLLFVWWWGALISLIVILGLTAYGFLKSRVSADNSRLNIREEDYRQTGLEPPLRWDAEAVKEKLDELLQKDRQLRWQDRLSLEREKRRDQLKNLDGQIRKIQEKREKLMGRLAALPESPFQDPRHYNALYWFINRALKWQQADEEVKSLEKKISSYENDIDDGLEKCSQLTQKYSLPPVGDSSGAKARFKQLRDQENKRKDAQEKIAAREKIIREKDSLIQRKKSDVASIYQKLKVEVDQKDEIRTLLDQLEKYNEAKQEVQVSRQRLTEAKNAMENHSGYASEKARIEELKLDQAQDIVVECKEKAGELEKINQKITEIETKINSKKEGNSLENALGKRDEALLNLKQRYNENLSSVT